MEIYAATIGTCTPSRLVWYDNMTARLMDIAHAVDYVYVPPEDGVCVMREKRRLEQRF